MSEEGGERYRLEHFTHGEMPPGLGDDISFTSDNIEDCITRVVSVMRLIAEYDPERWPSDEHWRSILPRWLLETFKEYTPEELQEIQADRSKWSNLAWDFRSWIFMVRERDWKWWSVERNGHGATIHLAIGGHPYTAKSLKHLISSAGGAVLG